MVHRYRNWSNYWGGNLTFCVVRPLGTSWLPWHVMKMYKQKSCITLAPHRNKVFSETTMVNRSIHLVVTLNTSVRTGTWTFAWLILKLTDTNSWNNNLFSAFNYNVCWLHFEWNIVCMYHKSPKHSAKESLCGRL